MQNDEFEWDDIKAAANALKHNVTFETASAAFDDPMSIEWDDDDNSQDEDRCCLVGMVDERLVFVSFTHRLYRVRIISARSATPYERRMYHEENQ